MPAESFFVNLITVPVLKGYLPVRKAERVGVQTG
jgi:hypothetical protein